MAQIQQLVDMGFEEQQVRMVLKEVNSNMDQAIERLLSFSIGGAEPSPPPRLPNKGGEDTEANLASKTSRSQKSVTGFSDGLRGPGTGPEAPPIMDPQLPPSVKDASAGVPPGGIREWEDADLSVALEMSMHGQQDGAAPLEAMRESGLPCGLRNVGNTCYVNSLLQTLLHVDEFRDKMLRYRSPLELEAAPEAEQATTLGPGTSRREYSIRLATELRHLCAFSLFTLRSCIDPSRLLNEIVDERGQKLSIGSQEDVGEFMLKLMDRLEEGLKAGGFAEDAPAPGPSLPSPEDALPMPALAPGENGSGKDASRTLLQTLFFGRQVQLFSYCEGASPSGDAVHPAGADVGVAPTTSTVAGSGDAVLVGAQPVDADQGDAVHLASAGVAGAAASATVDGSGDAVPIGAQPVTEDQDQVPLLAASAATPSTPSVSPAAAAVAAPAVVELATEAGNEAVPRLGAGQHVVNEEKCDFLQIFLDVKHKDLYSAWEAANCTEVDYKTPTGFTTTACTSSWIERLPKLLFFQLQRVIFDQEKKAQVKVDEAFEFDTTIYADRFLFAKKDRASEASIRARDLKSRRDQLAEALRRFEDVVGRPGLHAEEVLSWAADCLEANASTPQLPALDLANDPAAALEQCNPFALRSRGDLGGGTADCVKLLRRLQQSCSSEAAVLRAEMARLDAEIDETHRPFRDHPYELHAIWAHQGIAGSGHYWAYMRDWSNDRWIRFDDTLVSVVEWEDVRAAAVGQEGSNTSAYVLVYLEKELASAQSQATDQSVVSKRAEAATPASLLNEIRWDNEQVKLEQKNKEERIAERELRQHAEAIFQHFAGLIHTWEPKKRTQDTVGNPLDPAERKHLYDSALLCFELFLYRAYDEQKVWTHLLAQSIEAQRNLRRWKPEEEGGILFLLGGTLRSHKCYAQMLRDTSPGSTSDAGASGGGGSTRQCEFVGLDTAKLTAQYNVVLTQAHVIDEALKALQADHSRLIEAIGALALVWGNLEAEDKYRQNEVLLLMSSLMYNTVVIIERHKRQLSEAALAAFQPVMEYFLLLLHIVEWPTSWKQPLKGRIQAMCPQCQVPRPVVGPGNSGQVQPVVTKETVLQHAITQQQAQWEEFEARRPEPGQEFFERHRMLYSWVMTHDEAIARDYVTSRVPALREVLTASVVGTAIA